jgi:hypothetical protein
MAVIRAECKDRAGYREMIDLAKSRANAAASSDVREKGWEWVIAALARCGDLAEARASGHFDDRRGFLFPALMRAGDLEGAKRSAAAMSYNLKYGGYRWDVCVVVAEALVRAGRERDALRWVRTLRRSIDRGFANLGAARGFLPPDTSSDLLEHFDDRPSQEECSFNAPIWRPIAPTSAPATRGKSN